jgi:tRNA-2-methylthio-N6-dimethylallyladenosine synthase
MSAIFHIQTFGCQMNASDSDWLARSLKARGLVEGAFEEADVHILNTCSVRDKPEQKVYSELGRIARYRKVHQRRGLMVCVGGCVAQQVGRKLIRRFPEVRLVFGTDGIAQAPEAISRLLEEPGLRLSLLDFAECYEERQDVRVDLWSAAGVPLSNDDRGDLWSAASVPLSDGDRGDLGPAAGVPLSDDERGDLWEASRAAPEPDAPIPATEAPDAVPASVFVNIMQGCDNFCTYCIVPYVRGRQKSRRSGAIARECAALIAGGAREITLLGQNVNAYGQDLGGDEPGFAALLYKVAALPGLERLRFVTSHPKDIAPEVIAAFADLENLCPRLHLPLQSGSDRILKAMNRRYDAARYLDIVDRLRKARPDLLLTTDVIVGFPGETEEDFQATMRLMRRVGFASSFSFVYSDRPLAKAALLPGKVERPEALERLARLQAWQNETSDALLAGMVGGEAVILIEGRSRWRQLLEEDDQAGPAADRSGEAAPAQDLAAEAWQGKTPHGVIVNVNLAPQPGNAYYDIRGMRREWEGAMLPVRIESAARHSLKGRQAGAPW